MVRQINDDVVTICIEDRSVFQNVVTVCSTISPSIIVTAAGTHCRLGSGGVVGGVVDVEPVADAVPDSGQDRC